MLLTLSFISFLVPGLAVAGALAIASPIIIHLLSRRHRKPVAWGAMRFLIAAYRQQRRRLQLEQLLLLIARCLVVLLLGLALAGPMLSGCAGRTVSAVQQPGRVMWVVMDDSLTSQVQVAVDRTRFDEQKQRLTDMVEAMSPADRLAIWRLTDAGDSPMPEPTADRAALTDAIEAMQPRYVSPDWLGTFEQLSQTLERQAGSQDIRQVIVLSGLATDEELFGSQHQRLTERISEFATLYITPPAPESVNVQIQNITPIRRSILLSQVNDPTRLGNDDRAGSVSATVSFRRFSGLSSDQTLTMSLDLLNPDSKVVASQQRQVRFAPGQATTAVNMDLPVSITTDQLPATGTSVWSLRGRLDRVEGGDSILADDVAWSAVELRQQLSIVLVDDPLPAASRLTPGRWVELALSVGRSGDGSGLVVSTISPDALGGDPAIETADAVILLRPDGVSPAAWQRLAVRVEQGMVLMLTPPNQGVTTAWYGSLREQFALPWRVEAEVESFDTPGNLVTTSRSADALSLLSGDLPQLVQSIEVERMLGIEASPESVWLAVNHEDRDWPWMLRHGSKRGSVVLWASTFDAAWTNLQTKPMFVPLLHETLRSLCGGTGSALLVEAEVSQRPAMGEVWRSADRLVRQYEIDGESGDDRGRSSPGLDESLSVGLRPTQWGAEPVEALHEPGRYGSTKVAGGLLVVNIDADAGNTQASSSSGFDQWTQATSSVVWTAQEAALPTVEVGQQGMSLLWPLLWAALVLALIETVLARLVSHATVAQQAGLGERAWALLQRLGPWAARGGGS